MRNLQKTARNIFDLAAAIESLIKHPDKGSDLVEVNKTCQNCYTHYIYWHKDDCDGENELGLHYTCDTIMENGEFCGSTLVHRMTSNEELKKILQERKAHREASK